MAQEEEIEHAERIREHMNDDHAKSLADYVRFYCAPDTLVNSPCLERITRSEMKISWLAYDGERHVSTVAFEPPIRQSSEVRSRLIALAHATSISRVPRPARPPTTVVIFILTFFPLLALFAFAPDAVPKWLRPIQRISHVMFLGSLKAQQATTILSIVAHLAESFYAFLVIRRAAGSTVLIKGRTLYWLVQTILLGFPSLQLLLLKLRRMQHHEKAA